MVSQNDSGKTQIKADECTNKNCPRKPFGMGYGYSNIDTDPQSPSFCTDPDCPRRGGSLS